MCVLIFSSKFVLQFLILRRNELPQMQTGLHVKHTLFFFTDFNQMWTFSTDFFEKKSPNGKFRGNTPSGVPSCSNHAGGRADGRTDRNDEANSSFYPFCERA